MTAPARLLSVRLQGFKSFAERTHVSFGPGISAIVGPNGSGKSNLADALRWALGEQGRALRSRKAEDVIWAGSERRPALGMADVQLVLENADGLLPVEYGVVELGRRLYRSGENDYLLNRQRVRLRDLVDLLDGAHLADNAFLFIGQGMVDQALALRPEERRPLFEEVAGVRRHERRRRRAEEQLVESEANLARVEDILVELRPQVRRLSIQAQQQASRRTAGDELALALISTAHARWHAATADGAAAASALATATTGLDTAMAALARHEGDATAIAGRLADRTAAEADRRGSLDRARAAVAALQLREGRLESELAGGTRERERLDRERADAIAAIAAARETLATATPAREAGLEFELRAAEARLADALAEATAARAESAPDEADLAAIRRLEAVRRGEREIARRRAAEADAEADRAAARAAQATQAEAAARATHQATQQRLEATAAAEDAARSARERLEATLAQADAGLRSATDRATHAASRLAALRGRLEAAEQAAAALEADGFRVAARAAGGRPLDRAGRIIDESLRPAIEAVLAGLDRAMLVDRRAVGRIAGERGSAIVLDALRRPPPPLDETETAFLAAVRGRGGDRLADAIPAGEAGALGRLLARVAWLPSLADCLDLQATLPNGWSLAVRDGSAVLGEVVARLGRGGLAVDPGDVDRLRTEAADQAAGLATLETEVAAARGALDDARSALAAAREAESTATVERRRVEEEGRNVARAADGAARDAAWLAAHAERLSDEALRAREAAVPEPEPAASPGATGGAADGRATVEWEARVADLRARRDRLAELVAAADRRLRDADRQRAGAEAAAAIAEARLQANETQGLALAEREARLAADRSEITRALAEAAGVERDAAAAFEGILAADAADRQALRAAELEAGRARERVRVEQQRVQAAERADVEARVSRDGVREQLVVELGALGEIGLAHLRGDPTTAEPAQGDADIVDDRLGEAFDAVSPAWESTPPPVDLATPGRLASLRRRFHELGSGDLDAATEYEVVKTRLDGLEAQRADLVAAIERTRTLIAELDTLIATQFRTTFEALERAFESRFRQLFGGGHARLLLTDPDDVGASGVEIVARPPGKKPQALAMLSGGERALTAVALLFAMLEVRPVPFCVLDEVDAALDEANIGRFTDALRELSGATQCIVITHNRGTIETADALYGVTVGDDSVSRVISLRLEDEAGSPRRPLGQSETAAAAGEADRSAPADEAALPEAASS